MQEFFFVLWNNLPWFWLAVMVLCIAIEAFTMALTTVWFACGAFVLVFVSILPVPFKWQLFLFVAISLALLICTRPIALRHFHIRKTPTNSDSLIGRRTTVLQDIGRQEKGTVKANGIVWSARTIDGSPLECGSECAIVSIEGNTLVVQKIYSGEQL